MRGDVGPVPPLRSLRFEYELLVGLAVLQQSMGLAHKIVIPRRSSADDRRAPGDGELRGDHADRAGGTEDEQRLPLRSLRRIFGSVGLTPAALTQMRT